MKIGYVYILASERNGTLYVGATSNLSQRVYQHKEEASEGFTKRYGVKLLVWYEQHDSIEGAILREKQLKNWRRVWKLQLVEQLNPLWDDLYESIL